MSNLKLASLEGKIQASFNIGETPEATSRGHFLCGEQAKCHVLLAFRDGLQPTEEIASSISAQIDLFEVDADNSDGRIGLIGTILSPPEAIRGNSPNSEDVSTLGVHKMRSVERLSSFSDETFLSVSPSDNTKARAQRTVGFLASPTSICIPLEVWADSSLDFIEANVRITISIFEERQNDVLKELLGKPKLGSALLRNLLKEDAPDSLLNPMMTERIWKIDKLFRIARPISASLTCERRDGLDCADITVEITNCLGMDNSPPDETSYIIEKVDLGSGDDIHYDRHCIKITPDDAVRNRPITLNAGSSHLYGFSAVLNRMESGEHFPKLKLVIALKSASNPADEMRLAFEANVDLRHLFPEKIVDAIVPNITVIGAIQVRTPFWVRISLENRTSEDKEVIISRSPSGAEVSSLIPIELFPVLE